MAIDFKLLMYDTFIRTIENNIVLLAIIFIIMVTIFIFRHNIAFHLDLTKRESGKLTASVLSSSLFFGLAIMLYLYTKEHFLLLSSVLSFILTYLLYRVGVVDIVIEKLESK